MIFGTPEFCECLRRCRTHGLTMSQVQVLSLLSCEAMTRRTMAGLTGTEYNNIKKTVQVLIATGDAVLIGESDRQKIYSLSEQGMELVNKINL